MLQLVEILLAIQRLVNRQSGMKVNIRNKNYLS